MTHATELMGPLSLFFLMTIVGLELTPADFRRVASAPRAVIGGTLAQLALLPLMTWAVVAVLDVPPIFGAGAVLVAASPGAGMSNIMVAFGRANIALSVTLTAVASVLSVLTLPATTAIGMRIFLGDSVDVEIPVAGLIVQLSLALLLPLGLGMLLRARRPELAARYAKILGSLTLVTIVMLVAISIAYGEESEFSFEDVRVGLIAAAIWTLAAGAIGWGVAALLRLSPADRFTFLIEFSARNIAVSSIVALSGLARLDLTLFSVAYMSVGYPLVGAATLWRRLRGGLGVRD